MNGNQYATPNRVIGWLGFAGIGAASFENVGGGAYAVVMDVRADVVGLPVVGQILVGPADGPGAWGRGDAACPSEWLVVTAEDANGDPVAWDGAEVHSVSLSTSDGVAADVVDAAWLEVRTPDDVVTAVRAARAAVVDAWMDAQS